MGSKVTSAIEDLDAWPESWHEANPQDDHIFLDFPPDEEPINQIEQMPLQPHGLPDTLMGQGSWPIGSLSPAPMSHTYNTSRFLDMSTADSWPGEGTQQQPGQEEDDPIFDVIRYTPIYEDEDGKDHVLDANAAVLQEEERRSDEGDMNNIDVEWSGELSSAQDARDFLATLHEPLQIPKVEHDDARDIRQNQMPTLGAAVLKAIAHIPAPPPANMNEMQESYYLKQQSDTMGKIQKTLSTSQGLKKAESRALLLLDAAVDCHLVGLPKKDFQLLPTNQKTGYRSLTDLTCGERIARVTSCVQQNKIASLDVLEGKGFEHLARNPDHYLVRKIANVKSNGNKKRVHDDIQDLEESTVHQGSTEGEELGVTAPRNKAKKIVQGKRLNGKMASKKQKAEGVPFTKVTKKTKREALHTNQGDGELLYDQSFVLPRRTDADFSSVGGHGHSPFEPYHELHPVLGTDITEVLPGDQQDKPCWLQGDSGF